MRPGLVAGSLRLAAPGVTTAVGLCGGGDERVSAHGTGSGETRGVAAGDLDGDWHPHIVAATSA